MPDMWDRQRTRSARLTSRRHRQEHTVTETPDVQTTKGA